MSNGQYVMSELPEAHSRLYEANAETADQLMPLVYDELRKLAAVHLSHEQPGQTLQPTALVHEAYVRLIGGTNPTQWNSRGHFFAAAAVAIRRILIENARRKGRTKRGGGFHRQSLDEESVILPKPEEDLMALDEALEKLDRLNPEAARLVELLYFAGLTLAEAADTLEISPRTAGRLWAFARAWLRCEIAGNADDGKNF